jgi:tetratricopeptide (TPR) repeat protein
MLAEIFSLAVHHHQAGDFLQAEQLYRQFLDANPGHADAHHLLGLLAFRAGRLADAAALMGAASRLEPRNAVYCFNLGVVHVSQDRLELAAACFQDSVRLRPAFAEAHMNLASSLLQLGDSSTAIIHYRRVLELKPENADAHSGLGVAFADQANLDEAITHFRQALLLRSDFIEVHHNLATALQHQGRLVEARDHWLTAIRIQPNFAEGRQALALQFLLRGQFEQGWPDYEWRWRLPHTKQRHYSQPLWDGTALFGRTILLSAEQGRGDAIQFIRYVPKLKLGDTQAAMRETAKIIVECQAEMVPLLTRVNGVDAVVLEGKPLPDFDVQAPLLSLPGILRTSLASIPANIPYLSANMVLLERWRQVISKVRRPKSEVRSQDLRQRTSDCLVGIAWQGNPAYRGDRFRSIPLPNFAALSRIEGVQLINLQKGSGTDQLQTAAEYLSVLNWESEPDLAAGAFMDSAAILENLDLVISSDTAVVHLAGALGVPVWLAAALVPDWRWLLERDDSPWYPTMRLFRQTRCGCWDDVFERMAQELTRAVLSRSDIISAR